MRYIIKGSCYPTTVPNDTKLRVLRIAFQQLGDINCCHVNCNGCESGTVGNDHHPQGCFFDDDTQSIPLMFVGHLLFH